MLDLILNFKYLILIVSYRFFLSTKLQGYLSLVVCLQAGQIPAKHLFCGWYRMLDVQTSNSSSLQLRWGSLLTALQFTGFARCVLVCQKLLKASMLMLVGLHWCWIELNFQDKPSRCDWRSVVGWLAWRNWCWLCVRHALNHASEPVWKGLGNLSSMPLVCTTSLLNVLHPQECQCKLSVK